MKQSTSFDDELPRAAAPAPSEDAARVEVLSIVGLDEQAAIDHLTTRGLRTEVELLDVTDAALAGVVVEQAPAAGMAAHCDDVIVLRVGELVPDPPVSDAAEPPLDTEEDDWFDVPLPSAVEPSPPGQLATDSGPHEAQTTTPAPLASTAVRVRRRGRWLVLGAGLFVVALLLIFSRPEKPQPAAPVVRTVTVQAPAAPAPPSGARNRRPRRRAPALGSQRSTRPRGTRELRSESRSAPPPTPVVDAPAPSSGAGCEFCLERPSP